MDARADAVSSSGIVDRAQRDDSARLHYLDGLRGWAAVSVLIFHATRELFGRVVPALAAPRVLLNDGDLAVFVFFVLSGFVLSHQHLVSWDLERIRRVSLGRYMRLTIPIAAVSLLAYVLLELGVMFNQQASTIVSPGWLNRFFPFAPSLPQCVSFSLFDVYFRYGEAQSYNPFAWTMSYELIGSFMIFGTVALFGANVHARVLAGIGGVVLFYWQFNPFYLAFVYGYLLANLYPLVSRNAISQGHLGNVLGLLLLLFAAVLRAHDAGMKTAAAVSGCLLLAVMLSPFLRDALSSALSRWFGRLSFPLYLIHGLVICTLSSFMILRLHEAGWSAPAMAVVVTPTTIVVSLIAAQLFSPIEQLAIRSSHRFARLLATTGAK